MQAPNAKSEALVLRRVGLLLLNVISIGSSMHAYLSN
jgi:hypothetical protein